MDVCQDDSEMDEVMYVLEAVSCSPWARKVKKLLLDYFILDVMNIIIGYAETLGFQEIHHWTPRFGCFASGIYQTCYNHPGKFIISCPEGEPLRRSVILILHSCQSCFYNFTLTGGGSKSGLFLDCSLVPELSHIHRISSSQCLLIPKNPSSPALLTDPTTGTQVPQIQSLGGQVVVSFSKSYVLLRENLVSFFWRSSDSLSRTATRPDAYFYIRFPAGTCVDMKIGDGNLFVFFKNAKQDYFMASFNILQIENKDERMKLYTPNQRNEYIYDSVSCAVPVPISSSFYLDDGSFLLGVNDNRFSGLYLWDVKSSIAEAKWDKPVSCIGMVGKLIIILSEGNIIFLSLVE